MEQNRFDLHKMRLIKDYEFDHLNEPVLRKTCIRREMTYKWFASLFAS